MHACGDRLMSAAIRPGSLPPVIAPGEDATSISTNISYITLQRPFGWLWLSGLLLAFLLSGLLMVGICWLLYAGVGIWGLNIPVAWSFAIANYVWWIAIGMGGTFIS